MYTANPYIIALALILDLSLGDPRQLPHPVQLIGHTIIRLEVLLSGLSNKYFAGILLLSITTGSTAAACLILLKISYLCSPLISLILSAILSWTCLAARSLHRESALVADALMGGDINQARHYLSYIVGRDTINLEEPEIWRALIETVAENTSDGIIAPLFWLSLGGPVAGMTFKAISTLDSMVGYRNSRYLKLGWASARMDDLVNFIPARLTSLLMILSAPLIGLSFKGAFTMTLRDRLKHPSPNSAHPEASAAGALGIRLGGISSYAGVPSVKQFIGDPLKPTDQSAYRGMIHLMYASTMIMAGACIAILFFLKGTHLAQL